MKNAKHKSNSTTEAALKKRKLMAKRADSTHKMHLLNIQDQSKTQRLAKLASFPELNPNPVVEVTLSGQITFANPAAKTLFPSLLKKGTAHPYLTDWKSVAGIFGKGKKKSLLREIVADNVYYQQSVYFVKELQRVRIYGFDITQQKLAEKINHEAEERFHLLVDGVKDYAIFMLDTKGRVTSWNSGAQRMKGYKEAEILGQHIRRFYTPEDIASNKPERELKIAASKGSYQEDGWRVRKNGSRFWANVLITALRDKFGRLRGYAKVTRDITDRKRVEDELQRSGEELQAANEELATANEELAVTNEELLTSNEELRAAHVAMRESERRLQVSNENFATANEELQRLNRTLRAISNSNQAMMRAKDETELLNAACKNIVEDCGHKMVWIGYAEDDKNKSVRPVASSGFEKGYLETLNLTWADTERGRGPTGKAIRTGKVSMCRNMLTDPKFKPWRKEAIKRGYASSIVLPLKNAHKTFGALTIYSGQPNPFTKDEVKLLTELAEDLAYGITIMRLRTEHARAEEGIRRHNRLLQGMNRIFQGILSCRTEEELGRIYLSVAEEITQSKFGFIGEINAQGQLDDIAISDPGWAVCKAAIPKGHTGYKTVPGGFKIHGVYGRVLLDGKGFFTNDPASHPDSIGVPQGHPALSAFLGVPLISDGKTIGMVATGNRDGGYRQEDLETMEALSSAMVQAFMRFRAEDSLRQSEEQLKMAYKGGKIGAFEWNVQTGVNVWTPELEAMYGLAPGEFGKTQPAWEQLVHPEDRKAAVGLVKQTFETGEPVEAEWRVVWRDGSVHWIAGRFQLFEDAAGKPLRLSGVNIDITERKLAEETIRADLSALTKMHDLSSQIMGSGGFETLLQQIMDTAVKIVGAEKGTLQLLEGDTLRIVAHHGHKRPFLKFFANAENRASVCGEAMKRGQRTIVEDVERSELFVGTPSLDVLRAAGVRAVQSTPLLCREGKLLGVLTTQWGVPYVPKEHDLWRIDLLARQAADLIESKQAEEALRQSNEDLTRFNRAAVGRELRMIELKKEINRLSALTGQKPPYTLESEEEKA